MKREIKFRAWSRHDIKLGTALRFDMMVDEEEAELVFVLESDKSFRYNAVVVFGDPETWILDQYTGLNDEKGVEIYEGDIMRFEYNGRVSVSFIVWSLDGWRFNSYMPLGKLNLYPYVAASPNKYPKAEVIGNIYEHPHLLETI